MEKQIYCGRGSHIPYADYMHLIDLTFGFETPETQFLGLLPKLYREERRPQDSNYVVTEDGSLCAAVGAYDHGLTVCGDTLPCRGIGNVAVHPDYRSRGYMKMAMEAALDDMVRDGIALTSLGGRRQRYQYFSYDRCGPCLNFSFNRDNLRHVWGDLNAPFDDHRQRRSSAGRHKSPVGCRRCLPDPLACGSFGHLQHLALRSHRHYPHRCAKGLCGHEPGWKCQRGTRCAER